MTVSYHLPGQKFEAECKNQDGNLNKLLNQKSLYFLEFPNLKSKVPVSSNDVICISNTKNNRDLKDLVIPIPGGPMPRLHPSNDPTDFIDSCKKSCPSNLYESSALSYNGTTVGVCSCYDKYPYSPNIPSPPLFPSLLDSNGRVVGGLKPIDPFTFQTCNEFSSHYPIQGLFNMACGCSTNPWPYADVRFSLLILVGVSGLTRIKLLIFQALLEFFNQTQMLIVTLLEILVIKFVDLETL